jgi:hypothetical protein
MPPDGVEHFLRRGKYSERRQCAALEHRRAVYLDAEVAVRTADHFDVHLQIAPEPRRHPDGVQSRHSIGAGTDADERHVLSRLKLIRLFVESIAKRPGRQATSHQR